MKVYFTCSTADFAAHRSDYWAIRDLLVSDGHVLTRDWLAEAENRIDAGVKELHDVKEIYRRCIQAIREAELVIVEDTVSNFSTGHQITLALQLRKPKLVLWQNAKRRQFKQMFIHGIESDLLQVIEYVPPQLPMVLREFINKYVDRAERNRFHLVLSGYERNYLDWAQYVRGKSRTQLIRQALRSEIENDQEYRKYLRTKGRSNF